MFAATQKTIRRDRFRVYHSEHWSILASYQNQTCPVNPANHVDAPTSLLSAPAICGNRLLKFLWFREYRLVSLPVLTPMARYPSSLTSYVHSEASGNFETTAHSIGSMHSAFRVGRDS